MTNINYSQLNGSDTIVVHLLTNVSRALTYCDRFGKLLHNTFEGPVKVTIVVYPEDVPTGSLPNLKARLRSACARYNVKVDDVLLDTSTERSHAVARWRDMPRDRLASGAYSIWNDVTHDSIPSRERVAEYVIFELFPL